jgi:hypothetical protein
MKNKLSLPQMHQGECNICKEKAGTMIHNMRGDGHSYCYDCLYRALDYYMFHLGVGIYKR